MVALINPHSLNAVCTLLPFSPLQRFALAAGAWSIFAHGSWPPKGKTASPSRDPALPTAFPCPTQVLGISQVSEHATCHPISTSLLFSHKSSCAVVLPVGAPFLITTSRSSSSTAQSHLTTRTLLCCFPLSIQTI